MDNNICFNTNTFTLILLINIGLIVWSLYQVYNKDLEILQTREESNRTGEATLNQIESIIENKMAQNREATNFPADVTPVYTPTRGEPTDFYVVGYLSREKDPDRMVKLFERYLYRGRYEYCTENHINPTIRIPIYNHNYEQLTDGDHIKVPGYKGTFKVFIYPRDTPSFIPY